MSLFNALDAKKDNNINLVFENIQSIRDIKKNYFITPQSQINSTFYELSIEEF